MFLSALLTLSLSSSFCAAPVDSLDRLFERGRTYQAFLESANARRETWLENTKAATVDPAVLARGRGVGGEWRLLIVAEDWCGDSANTIPYVARLIDSIPSIALRVVNSTDGRWVMERYRTPDGRAATPTVVLLNGAGDPVGCFIERPAALRKALADGGGKGTMTVLTEWRKQDAGRSTVLEIVELLEAAAQGTGRCAASGS
jgi:hypothetical protein